jgi:cytochrome o ubiquinol oxidase subunit 1
MGFYIGTCSMICGFAMTWYIWWLAMISLAAVIILATIRLSSKDEHELIPAAQIKKLEEARQNSEQYA